MRVLPGDEAAPVRDYLFTRAAYTGVMGKDAFDFTADFTLMVLKEQGYVTIPVLSGSLALKGMTINDRPALVVNEGGNHCLIVDKPGEYRLKALFSIRSSPDKGPHRLLFPIQEIPITLADVVIPIPDIEVEIPSAQYLERDTKNGTTSIKAILAACSSFEMQWRKRLESAERVPALLYAESYQLVSVEDDGLRINQDVFYNVLHSGVAMLRLAISEGVTVLSVTGPGVGDWQEVKEEDQRLLLIPLDYEQQGRFNITILSEKSFAENSTLIEFAGLKVLDTVNGLGEKGYIGVDLKTSAELVLMESSGLEKVMVKNLSRGLFEKSSNPLILGFTYLRHPYNLVMDVKRHEKVALPQATVDSASMVSFFTEEGLTINKVEYAVKNQLKQSLRLKLPEGAHIWSAVVGEESVEVSRNEGFMLVPLISSRQRNKGLEPFRVELIYYTEAPGFSLWGGRYLSMPQIDLTVSQLLWSVYLPEKFFYYRFVTNLEKEELASGLNPFLQRGKIRAELPGKNLYGRGGESDRAQEYAQRRGKANFKNMEISSTFMSQQVKNEFDFDSRLHEIEDKMIQGETRVDSGAGVLPVNIQIPASGQLYRFARNIVRDEPLEITVHYFRETLFLAMAWFVILALILAAFLFRRNLTSLFLNLMGAATRGVRAGVPQMKGFFLAGWSLPLLCVLFLFSLWIGGLVAFICFLLVWILAMARLDRRIKRSKTGIHTTFFIILLLVFLCSVQIPCALAQDKDHQKVPMVSLDWDEFKRSIALDRDEIALTWDEFQKIVSQSSKGAKPAYTIQDGKVFLSREQFDRLLGQMVIPRHEITVPLDYRLTSAVYKGRMTQHGIMVTADFILEVLAQDGYKLIPFLSSQLALEDVQVSNGKPPLLLTQDGNHYLIIKDPGNYRIKASFSLRSSLKEADYQVSIPVQETSITMLDLEIPLEDISVKVPQAQQVTVSTGKGSTRVSAIFPPVRDLTVQWYGKKAAPAVQKIPAKIYCQSYNLISIEDDALKVTMDIEYSILHAGVNELSLAIPEGLHVFSVKGEGVGEWSERRLHDERILHISLDYEHKGVFLLTVEYERTLLESAGRFSFSTLRVLDAVKDTGYMGLELKGSAEVKVIRHEGLEKIAIQKLPRPLFSKSVKPFIFGFKYLRHPHSLELDIQRHPKVSVAMAVIDSANAVSFFTEDGKVVHRIIYEVRNQFRQFLKIRLPEGGEVWSVFVGDEPAEPAREKDVLYIPLIRSPEEGRRLKPFKVEVVYFEKGGPFAACGEKAVFLPQVTEMLVSTILWSLYLPKDYSFLHFGGSLEKERLVSGIRPVMGCSCSKRAHRLVSPGVQYSLTPSDEGSRIQTDAWKDKETVPAEEEKLGEFKSFKAGKKEVMRQQALEQGVSLKPMPQTQKPGKIVSGYDTAVLSIPVSIPLSGQLYRFAKTMVRQEPLVISMVYARGWIRSAIGWLILLLLLVGLYALRKRISRCGRILHGISQDMDKGYVRIRHLVKRAYNATLTPLILLGFVIAAAFSSRFLAASLLFLAGLCTMLHQRSYWFARSKRKIEERKMEKAREKANERKKGEAQQQERIERIPDTPAPEGKAQPAKRKWLRVILLLSLGIAILAAGFMIFLIYARLRYPNVMILFFTVLCVILYYLVLSVWWIVHWIKHRKK